MVSAKDNDAPKGLVCWVGWGVTAVSRASEKGALPWALEGGESRSRDEVEERQWPSDLRFGCDMEGVLEGEVGSKEPGEGAVEAQVAHRGSGRRWCLGLWGVAIGMESRGRTGGRRTRLGHSMWWRGRISVFSLVSGPGTGCGW